MTTSTNKVSKFAYIDIVRGLAVLMVIMVHVGNATDLTMFPKSLQSFIVAGRYGVQLFFIASAFTIFLSFKNRAGKEAAPVRNFFIRRVFRIAPLYILALVYYLWQNGTGPNFWSGGRDINATAVLLNVTFTHGFNPYYVNSVVPGGWSIAVEMAFYALVPFLFTRVKSLNGAINLLSATLIFKAVADYTVSRYFAIPEGFLFTQYLDFYLPAQLPVFAMGIMFYFLTSEGSKRVSGTAATLLFGVLVVEYFTHRVGINNHIMIAGGLTLLVYGMRNLTLNNFVTKTIAYIGNVSFSMYLVHFAVIYAIEKYIPFPPAETRLMVAVTFVSFYALIVILSTAMSVLTFRAIEQPSQQLGKALINFLDQRVLHTANRSKSVAATTAQAGS